MKTNREIKAIVSEMRKAENSLERKSGLKIQTGFVKNLLGTDYFIMIDDVDRRFKKLNALNLETMKREKVDISKEADAKFWKKMYLDLKGRVKGKKSIEKSIRKPRPKKKRGRKPKDWYKRVEPVVDSRGRLVGHCLKHKKFLSKCNKCVRQWRHKHHEDMKRERGQYWKA